MEHHSVTDDIVRFRLRRQAAWQQLDRLIAAPRRTLASGEQFTALIRLYRQVSNDLSYATTFFPEQDVTRYLNQLVARAHHLVYPAGGIRIATILTFFTAMFPRAVRRLGLYIATSAAVMAGGGGLGYALTRLSPIAAYTLLPASFLALFNPSHAGAAKTATDTYAPLVSSVIMTHNMVVALQVFVGGLTLGFYTAYNLWYNGVVIGVLAALFQQAGDAGHFWSLIVPHGVTELTAVSIAGGAGLLFAHRLVSPGRLGRRTALLKAGREAVLLMLGVVPMLIIAGTIEGFVTPSPLPLPAKYGVAVATALGWLLYFGFAGRGQRPRHFRSK